MLKTVALSASCYNVYKKTSWFHFYTFPTNAEKSSEWIAAVFIKREGRNPNQKTWLRSVHELIAIQISSVSGADAGLLKGVGLSGGKIARKREENFFGHAPLLLYRVTEIATYILAHMRHITCDFVLTALSFFIRCLSS